MTRAKQHVQEAQDRLSDAQAHHNPANVSRDLYLQALVNAVLAIAAAQIEHTEAVTRRGR